MTDLRRQRLHALAESYCQERLASDQLSEQLRLQLTVELARTFTQHATLVPVSEQELLLEQAEKVLTSYPLADLDELQRLYLTVNRHRLNLTAGEASYWQAQLINSPESRKAALQKLVNAIDPAREYVDDMGEWTRARSLATTATGDRILDYLDLLLLQREFRLDIAKGLLHKATLIVELESEIEREEIPTALPQVNEDYRTSTAYIGIFQKQLDFPELYFDAHLLEADWELLLGRYQALETRFGLLRKRSLSREKEIEIIIREARALMQQGQNVAAAKQLHQQQQSGQSTSPELDFLTINAFLELARVAKEQEDEDLEGRLMENINARLVVIEPGYWAERARRLFSEKEKEINYGSELQNLMAEAADLSKAGKWDDAATAYERAIELAKEREATALQADLLYQLGLVRYQQKSFDTAAVAFQRVVEESGDEEEISARAHLMLAYCSGQQGDQAASKALLEEHLKRFPESTTFHDALRLLAHLELSAEHYGTALEYYRTLHEAKPDDTQIELALISVYDELAGTFAKSPAESKRLLEKLRGDFPDAIQPVTEANLARQVTLRFVMSRLILQAPTEEKSEIAALLDPLRSNGVYSSPAFTPYREPFITIFANYLLQTPLQREDLNEIGRLPLELKLGLFRALTELAPDQANYHSLREMLERQLQQQQAELSPEQEREFLYTMLMRKYREGDALTSLGELDLIEQKLKLSPEQTLEIALLLMDSPNSSERLEASLGHWRRLESEFQAGTEAWFETRYYQIKLMNDLGQREEANKLKRLTLLLHKLPVDSEWKTKFDSL